jgi:hypothetical protein
MRSSPPRDRGALRPAVLPRNCGVTIRIAPRNLANMIRLIARLYAACRSAVRAAAAGVGMNRYRESSLLVTAAVAHKIGSNPNPGLARADADGRDSSTRFWLQVAKYW